MLTGRSPSSRSKVGQAPSAYRALAIGTLLTAFGRGLYVPTSVLYFQARLDLSANQIGLALGCAGAGAFLAAVPLGTLLDAARRPRDVAVGYAGLHAAAMFGLLATGSYPALVVAVTLLGVAERGSAVARQTLVALLFDRDTAVVTQARLRRLANIGMSVGALAAAGAISKDSTEVYGWLIAGNGAALAVLAGLLTTVTATRVARPERGGAGSVALRDTRFLTIALLNGALSVHSSILRVGVPLWVALHTDLPVSLVAILFATNTILTVLGQVSVADRVRTLPAAAGMLRRSGVLTAGACLALASTQLMAGAATVVALFLAVALVTAGELTQAAGGWGLAFGLAQQRAEGSYLGVFSLGGSMHDLLGPVVVTAFVVGLPVAGPVTVAVVLAAIAVLVPTATRHLSEGERNGSDERRRSGRHAGSVERQPGGPGRAGDRSGPLGQTAVLLRPLDLRHR